MSLSKNVPKNYWGEVVLTAAHLINKLPSKVLDDKTPKNLFSKFFPDFKTINHLTPRIFGCVSFIHNHSHHKGKFDSRALKCIFVGYSSTQKGYKSYHPPTKKFHVFVDVTFVEHQSHFAKPYLLGKTSFMENNDKDLLLLDLSLSPSSSSSLLPPPLSPNEPPSYNQITPITLSSMGKDKHIQSVNRPL